MLETKHVLISNIFKGEKMPFKHPILLSLLASIWLFPTHVYAQTPTAFDPITFELVLAQAGEPEARLKIVNNAIRSLKDSDNSDNRMYFDLLTISLELYLELGDRSAAAQKAETLAILAAYQPDGAPLRYLRIASQNYTAIGNASKALLVFESEITLRRDSGQFGDPIASVYREMAQLAERHGDQSSAKRYLQQAATALTSVVTTEPAEPTMDPIDLFNLLLSQNDTPVTEPKSTPPSTTLSMADVVNLGIPDRDPSTKNTSTTETQGFREIDVFYATDRARTGSSEPANFYGHGRGELEYGQVTVSVPDTHVPGEIEAPSIWRLEFGPTPTKHIMVRKVSPQAKARFFAVLQDEMQTRTTKEAFVFVHGFNTRFDAAAKRAAQLAHDMNYSGVPVLYSWPSAGKTVSYVADTAVVRLSGRRLSHFLEDLHGLSGADTIHIVAHSMGNRALTDALELLALRSQAAQLDTPMFGQIFFAAPDVDAGLFAEMMPTIRPLAKRLTLYASNEDWALSASRKLHGDAPRAGQAGGSMLVSAEFDTIDMSDLGDDMLAHTYFASDNSALADIVALLWRNPAPANRCGLVPITANTGAGSVWKYKKGECFEKKVIALISRLWPETEVTPELIRGLVASVTNDTSMAGELEAILLALLEGR